MCDPNAFSAGTHAAAKNNCATAEVDGLPASRPFDAMNEAATPISYEREAVFVVGGAGARDQQPGNSIWFVGEIPG